VYPQYNNNTIIKKKNHNGIKIHVGSIKVPEHRLLGAL
jgi:hypothetical protein